ncbi:MAG TPA: hypothetical protein VJ476_02095 [Rhizomicrobium sp.]|nr:hypothetical protein [Rhizomicrobium sp.]
MKQCILSGALAAALAVAPAQARSWAHYSNATLGYTIAYPANWTLDTNYVSASLGPDHEIHGTAFHVPAAMTAGTNLSTDSALSVESIPESNCMPSQFVDPAENVHTVHAGGLTYTAASSSDAGAGNRYETQVFVVADTSPCLAMRYFIHYAAIENYDPGTVKAFDKARLLRTFDAIRATLKLGK